MNCARSLSQLDPEAARKIDTKIAAASCARWRFVCSPANRHRPRTNGSVARRSVTPAGRDQRSRLQGVFVFATGRSFITRINQRVEAMFEHGVIEEVRAAGAMSATASQMIGLREIRELLEGKMSTLAMHRGDSASHPPLCQKTVDLVSAPN